MKIAVLAWGSLIWDPDTLKVADDFSLSGPCLPIEFSRISKGERLTLVIDEHLGNTCPTYSATSGSVCRPVRGAARSGATQTRDLGPGSAAHHFMLRSIRDDNVSKTV
jgi:hypothetical protein